MKTRVSVHERLVRENRRLTDRLRRAERALKEGRSWASYEADEAITVNGEPA